MCIRRAWEQTCLTPVHSCQCDRLMHVCYGYSVVYVLCCIEGHYVIIWYIVLLTTITVEHKDRQSRPGQDVPVTCVVCVYCCTLLFCYVRCCWAGLFCMIFKLYILGSSCLVVLLLSALLLYTRCNLGQLQSVKVPPKWIPEWFLHSLVPSLPRKHMLSCVWCSVSILGRNTIIWYGR